MSFADYARSRVENVTCRHCGWHGPEGNDCDCAAMFVSLVEGVDADDWLRIDAAQIEPHDSAAAAELRVIAEGLKAWRDKGCCRTK